ncbi:hypothetical protein TWF106_010570 [Orbilia oligospora]|uniref:Uncharacterized protein n=1 Tax=Orbilia oligospora TaxID=2813651 RepID=A0A7C8V3F0_ORBOL|nr:hypothetical protein TWF106_010570 [Orbilia oligospora]
MVREDYINSSKLPLTELKPLKGLRAFIFLIGHSVFSIALALVVALAIDGYQAIDTSAHRYVGGKIRLHVSDVTTFVSVGLVLVKLFVSSWSVIAIWDCACQLSKNKEFGDFKIGAPRTAKEIEAAEDFEITKVAATDQTAEVNDSSKANDAGAERVSFMLSWRVPPWFMFPPKLPKQGGSWIILLALLFMLPQPFLAPLLSGSIDWASSSTPGDRSQNISSVSPTADFNLWYWYNVGGYIHNSHLRRAAGYAALAWANPAAAAKNGTSITGNGCRHVMNDDGLPVNSTVYNVTIPCIRIHSISWAVSAEEVSSADVELITGGESKKLSQISEDLSLYYTEGATVVFDANKTYKVTDDTSVLPSSTLFSGTKSVGLLLTRQDITRPLCRGLNPTIFGPGNRYDKYYNPPDHNDFHQNCYLVGKIEFTAGVTTSRLSKYIAPRIIEDSTPIDEVVFEPDPWVQEAIWLLPDLMTMLSNLNSSLLPTWDNLDGYTEALLRQAYLGAWDAFHGAFQPVGPSVVAIPQEQRITASVSFKRVFGWLAGCFLVPLAGILLLTGGGTVNSDEVGDALNSIVYEFLSQSGGG